MENTMNTTPMEQPRNNNQKLPVILVLDTSGSMEGDGIKDLNQGIDMLKSEILNDPSLQSKIELGIVSFNDTATVERALDLVTVDTAMPLLTAGGLTNTLSGVNAAIAEIATRKHFYRTSGEQYYRPYIILMTDGASSNSEEELVALRTTLQKGVDCKQYVFTSVAVGDAADVAGLARMSPSTTDKRLKRHVTVIKLKDTSSFHGFFSFLSSSIAAAAADRTGVAEGVLNPEVGQIHTFTLND
jgi:uncharacterized protein YegL